MICNKWIMECNLCFKFVIFGMDRKRGFGDFVFGVLVLGLIKFSGFIFLIFSCYVLLIYLLDLVVLFYNNR